MALATSGVFSLPSRPQRATPAVAAAQAGGAIILAGVAGSLFPGLAPHVPVRLVAGACTLASTAAGLWLLRPRPAQNAEDLACGTWISGLPGSGKTSLVVGRAREHIENGEGGCWLSTKGAGALLPYVPAAAVDRTDLVAPAAARPRGINLLRLYQGGPREHELAAGFTVGLFERLYPHLSANMAELIRMAALALLAHSEASGQRVALPHLYLLFQSEGYRQRVIGHVANPAVRHALTGDDADRKTVAAVLRQLRRTVASEALLLALGQPDGVDLRQAMAAGRWVIADADERLIGPAAADLILQVLVSQIELLTPARPWPRPLWHVIADESERYQTPSFLRAVEISREYRVAWWLLHQASGQLNDQVLLAAKMCGSQIFLQQHADDNAAAQRATGRTGEREVDFSRLPKRRYIARLRLHGRPVDAEGVTDDLPEPDEDTVAEIRKRNATGPTRDEILGRIYRLLAAGDAAERGAAAEGRRGLVWA